MLERTTLGVSRGVVPTVIAAYIGLVAWGCCLIWLIAASSGLDRGKFMGWAQLEPSWTRVWAPALASGATAATYLIIMFAEGEAPVSVSVVLRGWLGLFVILSAASALAAAVIMALVKLGARQSRRRRERPASTQ